MIHRIKYSFWKIWLKEFHPSFQHDSQSWIFLFNMTHRNWTLLFNITQRIEPTFFEYDSKIWTFLCKEIWLKELNLGSEKKPQKNGTLFFNMTQRIELFFFCNLTQRIQPFFFNMTQRIVLFFNITLRIDPSCFPIWFNKLNHGSKYALALKNWSALRWHADLK